MGFRPDFGNPLAGIGEGLSRAAETVGRFFSQRAQEAYQEGVATISDAKTELERLNTLRGDPNFSVDSQEEVALSELERYWTRVSTMSPYEARSYVAQNPPPKGVTVDRITRPAQRAARTAATQQGGPGGAGFGSGSAPRAASTEVTTTPEATGQFVTRLERQTAQAGRSYQERLEDRLANRDFSFQRLLNKDQQDANITLAEMQMAHDVRMQQGEQAFQAHLASLAREHDVNLVDLQAGYEEARDARLFEQELAAGERTAAWDQARAASEAYSKGDPWGEGVLRDMAANSRMPSSIREFARTALEGDVTAQRDAYVAQLEEAAAKSRAAASNAEDRTEAEQRILEAQAVEAEALAEIAGINITVAGQDVILNNLRITGAQLAEQRERFEQRAYQIDSVTEYVKEAIELGLPSRLEELRQAVQNQDTSSPLWHLAQNASVAELDQAIEVAQRTRQLSNREMEFANEQIDQAIDDMYVNGAIQTTELMNSLAEAYDPDTLETLGETNPKIKALMEQGLLSQADLDAAAGRARTYEALRKNEVNGPRIEMLTSTLNQYGDPARFPTTEEEWNRSSTGLRNTLNELVKLGYMDEGEVDGLVALYQAGWRTGADSHEMDMALAQANLNVLRSQSALNAARAAGEGATGGLDTEYVAAYRQVLTASIDGIMEEARSQGCLTEDGQFINEGDCAQYPARVRLETNKLIDLGNAVQGQQNPFSSDSPQVSTPDGFEHMPMLGEIARLQTRINANAATDEERAAYEMYMEQAIDVYGSEEGVARALGFDVPTPEPEPAPDSGATRQGPPRTLGGDVGRVGQAVSGAANAVATGAQDAASRVGRYVTGGAPAESGGGVTPSGEGVETPQWSWNQAVPGGSVPAGSTGVRNPPGTQPGGSGAGGRAATPTSGDIPAAERARRAGADRAEVLSDLGRASTYAQSPYDNTRREQLRRILQKYGLPTNESTTIMNATLQDAFRGF